MATDYTRDFVAFFRDKYPVKGSYGPRPVCPPFLVEWLRLAFPLPDGNPAARNVLDSRSKKQGKSALAGAVALYMATRQPYAEVVIAAADKDQARDRVFRSTLYAVDHGPLRRHARLYKDAIEFDHGSVIQAIPNDWKGAAGGDYSCVVYDELWTATLESERRRYDELVIPPTQPDGVRWIASYAGFEGESELLEDVWKQAESGESVHDELPIYHNREASLLAMIDQGPESWRMPWTDERFIEQVRASERPATFARLWLNEWVSSISTFVTDEQWQACALPEISPYLRQNAKRMVLGADASTTRDLTALVGVVRNPKDDTVHAVHVRTWQPTKGKLRAGKPTVDLGETIKAEILDLHAKGYVDAVVYDPYQLHSIAVDLEKRGVTMIELPQTTARTKADQALYDAIISKSLKHYDHPTLNEHVKHAVAAESARGFRLAKEKTKHKIDAAVALSMAHYGATSDVIPRRKRAWVYTNDRGIVYT